MFFLKIMHVRNETMAENFAGFIAGKTSILPTQPLQRNLMTCLNMALARLRLPPGFQQVLDA